MTGVCSLIVVLRRNLSCGGISPTTKMPLTGSMNRQAFGFCVFAIATVNCTGIPRILAIVGRVDRMMSRSTGKYGLCKDSRR